MQKILLHEGWRMRPADSDEWINAHVPGSVLADLLASKRIDDPFWRTNEYAARDLFNKDYEYCAEFNITEDLLSHDSLMLVCEGLDTLTEIHIKAHSQLCRGQFQLPESLGRRLLPGGLLF